jgi:hypothetical protein
VFTKKNGYALHILGSKNGKDGTVDVVFCYMIVADLVHLVYGNRTGGESGVPDALIVPSLGYGFIRKHWGLGYSKFTIVDTTIYPFRLQHTPPPQMI